jgi:hypothetical protein
LAWACYRPHAPPRPMVIGSTSKATFGTESRSTVPGNGPAHFPFFGGVSFLAFIDSRKR